MTAKINLRTGKIIGAKRGSFAWFHECGHIAYDDSEEGITNGVYQNMITYCCLLFLAIGQFILLFKYLALVSVVMLFYYLIKEEMWCNNYAKNKLKGGK